MRVYIVTRNDRPLLATFSEREACDRYNGILHSGRYRQAGVLFVSANEGRRRVLLQAYHAA